jgi:hypothetical protein
MLLSIIIGSKPQSSAILSLSWLCPGTPQGTSFLPTQIAQMKLPLVQYRLHQLAAVSRIY